MSRFIQLSPKTIGMINIENVIKVHPCEAGYWRWLVCNMALEGTIIGSRHVTPTHDDAIRLTPILIFSNRRDTLTFCRRRTTRDTRWWFYFWLFSLVWFMPPKKLTLWKMLQKYQGWSALGGGLGGVCVCVSFVVLLCGSISRALSLQLNTVPFTGSDLFYFVSASSLLCISWLFIIFLPL